MARQCDASTGTTHELPCPPLSQTFERHNSSQPLQIVSCREETAPSSMVHPTKPGATPSATARRRRCPLRGVWGTNLTETVASTTLCNINVQITGVLPILVAGCGAMAAGTLAQSRRARGDQRAVVEPAARIVSYKALHDSHDSTSTRTVNCCSSEATGAPHMASICTALRSNEPDGTGAIAPPPGVPSGPEGATAANSTAATTKSTIRAMGTWGAPALGTRTK